MVLERNQTVYVLDRKFGKQNEPIYIDWWSWNVTDPRTFRKSRNVRTRNHWSANYSGIFRIMRDNHCTIYYRNALVSDYVIIFFWKT